VSVSNPAEVAREPMAIEYLGSKRQLLDFILRPILRRGDGTVVRARSRSIARAIFPTAHRYGERSLRRCVLELGESRLRALRRDEVALALVALECLLERGGCFVGLAREQEHLGEVGVCVSLLV